MHQYHPYTITLYNIKLLTIKLIKYGAFTLINCCTDFIFGNIAPSFSQWKCSEDRSSESCTLHYVAPFSFGTFMTNSRGDFFDWEYITCNNTRQPLALQVFPKYVGIIKLSRLAILQNHEPRQYILSIFKTYKEMPTHESYIADKLVRW